MEPKISEALGDPGGFSLHTSLKFGHKIYQHKTNGVRLLRVFGDRTWKVKGEELRKVNVNFSILTDFLQSGGELVVAVWDDGKGNEARWWGTPQDVLLEADRVRDSTPEPFCAWFLPTEPDRFLPLPEPGNDPDHNEIMREFDLHPNAKVLSTLIPRAREDRLDIRFRWDKQKKKVVTTIERQD